MYKCVFHPRTLLVTDKTIAFFVGRGHWPRCSPALTQTKISKARYRGESHRTVSGLALYCSIFYVLLPRLPALPNQAAVLDSLDGFGDFFHRQGQGKTDVAFTGRAKAGAGGADHAGFFNHFHAELHAGAVPLRDRCPDEHGAVAVRHSRWSGSPRTGRRGGAGIRHTGP